MNVTSLKLFIIHKMPSRRLFIVEIMYYAFFPSVNNASIYIFLESVKFQPMSISSMIGPDTGSALGAAPPPGDAPSKSDILLGIIPIPLLIA